MFLIPVGSPQGLGKARQGGYKEGMTQTTNQRTCRTRCSGRRRVLAACAWAILAVLAAGCSEHSEKTEIDPVTAENYAAAFEAAEMTSSAQRKWARSCALCHVRGEGGAPKMGDTQAWAPRLSGGDVLLMRNTVEGFNRMPPLGYCMDCEFADFAAMINMMTGRR
jgi:cytochrome c5